MEKVTSSVKDMLVSGSTAEELLESLRDEIERAQAEIAAENAKVKESNLDVAREALADALIAYIATLDIVPAEVMNEITQKELVDVIKSTEEQVKAYAAITTLAAGLGIEPKPASRGKRTEVCKCKEMSPADEEVIREFLKSLR